MDFVELQEQREQALIAFLTVELDLGFTFLAMAQQHRRDDDRERSLQNARKALEAVRHFGEGIADIKASDRIRTRVAELGRLLSTFPTSKGEEPFEK